MTEMTVPIGPDVGVIDNEGPATAPMTPAPIVAASMVAATIPIDAEPSIRLLLRRGWRRSAVLRVVVDRAVIGSSIVDLA
jgi:hypothetical protein